ncbi:hypothetical protein PTE30175_01419 [Pandoraea terrae]|uniref:Outer membrane protein beta-barrel domain-containing protein n=1 Tax=Pandoraea terrae TaxID=1537710 RepID=A0A5E4TKQ3_9BURK|nr:hypothetical protein [Pandoraea terrae]VVD88435.1 hypothetical protein PTE30175_01419 [Pandoraea terrae]
MMPKTVCLTVCACLGAASAIYAPSDANAQEAILRANNQVWAGLGGHHLQYDERIDAARSDSESGTQFAGALGGVAQGTVFGLSNIYAAGSLRFARGNTQYNGYLQDNRGRVVVPSYQMDTRSTTADLTLKVGRAFPLAAGRAQLTPYASYTYHDWIRDSTRNPVGFYERYRHHVVSAGLMGQFEVTPGLVANADVRAGTMVGANMTLSGSSNTFNLGNKPVYSAGLGLDYAVARNVHVNASYEWTRFKYGRSDLTPVTPGITAYEPDSRTTQQVWMVGLGYAF